MMILAIGSPWLRFRLSLDRFRYRAKISTGNPFGLKIEQIEIPPVHGNDGEFIGNWMNRIVGRP
jgi:hypothetical protein